MSLKKKKGKKRLKSVEWNKLEREENKETRENPDVHSLSAGVIILCWNVGLTVSQQSWKVGEGYRVALRTPPGTRPGDAAELGVRSVAFEMKLIRLPHQLCDQAIFTSLSLEVFFLFLVWNGQSGQIDVIGVLMKTEIVYVFCGAGTVSDTQQALPVWFSAYLRTGQCQALCCSRRM